MPSGRSIALFFLDAIVSHQVAFERLLDDGQRFLDRLSQGFDDRREHAQLMHIATDGESYGHHHAHGDMALAYCLTVWPMTRKFGLPITANSSSCTRPSGRSRFTKTARGAVSTASSAGGRTAAAGRAASGTSGGAARSARRSTGSRRSSTTCSARGDASASPTPGRPAMPTSTSSSIAKTTMRSRRSSRGTAIPTSTRRRSVAALRLLEMQTDAMLMFTSCGWFHDEISGIETIQCLQYAAGPLTWRGHLAATSRIEFHSRSRTGAEQCARSFGDGRGVWEQLVRPGVVDLERVLAHHAISLIYQPPVDGRRQRVYSFELETLEKEVRTRGKGHLAMGRLQARSLRTWNEAEARFVVIHYGGLDFHAVLCLEFGVRARVVRVAQSRGCYKPTRPVHSPTSPVWLRVSFPGARTGSTICFATSSGGSSALCLRTALPITSGHSTLLANQDEEVLSRLGQLNYPIPKPMRAAASTFLDLHLAEAINRLACGESASLDAIEQLHERGQGWGYERERGRLELSIADAVARSLEEIRPNADLVEIVARAKLLLAAARLLGAAPDLWQFQNRFLTAVSELFEAQVMDAPLRHAFESLAADLRISHRLLAWRS